MRRFQVVGLRRELFRDVYHRLLAARWFYLLLTAFISYVRTLVSTHASSTSPPTLHIRMRFARRGDTQTFLIALFALLYIADPAGTGPQSLKEAREGCAFAEASSLSLTWHP